MNTIAKTDLNNCVGCSACSFVCPKNSIIMKRNAEGFLYPMVENEVCIGCGLCLLTCPMTNSEALRNKVKKAFGAYIDDPQIYSNSSSGGVFAACALYFLRNNGVVVGAEMQSDYSVRHSVIYSTIDLPKIQGTKYVQSDMSDIYSVISDYLAVGKSVLFSGTPCQVAGLTRAMHAKKISTDRLVTIDIVCHGVPSPLFFSEHIRTVYGDVSDIRFRQKTKHELSGYAIGFRKNGSYQIITPTNKDFYYACYSSQVSLRESCYRCSFANPDRVGDITLGDLATQNRYSLGSNHACSVVAINTKKGLQLFESLEHLEYTHIDYESEIKANAQMSHPTVRPKERDTFYKELFLDGKYDEENAQKYRKVDSLKSKVKYAFTSVTSPVFRKSIKSLIKRT